MAIYTVFHEESESEVEKSQILEPGGKILENGIPGSNFLSKFFLFIAFDVVKHVFRMFQSFVKASKRAKQAT